MRDRGAARQGRSCLRLRLAVSLPVGVGYQEWPVCESHAWP